MSHTWMIQGQVREKPKTEHIRGEYQGEDVYHPNQPNRGQIDEMLVNPKHSDKAILIGINPGPDDTVEDIAEEVKQTCLWGLKR